MKMTPVVLLLFVLFYLRIEKYNAEKHRKKFVHVIHVNGIRGKSTVTRLIDAGLRSGGKRVFCKTTGTVPIYIDTKNQEHQLIRRGRANIKEQLTILHRAEMEGAEILVIECMAVDPVLQYVAQHKMLQADIGVITNVRLDHIAEMGETLEEICNSLSNTIPRNGTLFTGDSCFFSQLSENAARIGCHTILAESVELGECFDFPENVGLALAVCEKCGVCKEDALRGMQKYQRDPYALSLYRISGGGIFVNGLSINDPQSTQMVYERLERQFGWKREKLLLLINNRPDRGYRTQHMILVAQLLQPKEIWLIGASKWETKRKIDKHLSDVQIRCFRKAEELPFKEVSMERVIFAVGNIAGEGRRIMERVRMEGKKYVS